MFLGVHLNEWSSNVFCVVDAVSELLLHLLPLDDPAINKES